MIQLRRSLNIFVPPLILVLVWFYYEKTEFYLPNFQLKADYYEPKQLNELIGSLPQLNKAKRESTEPIKFPVQENTLTGIGEILNQTILDKLGSFANLPIHTACLINRNRITSEGEPAEIKKSNTGTIGIIPKTNQSLNFYAKIWESDCKSVFKKDFKDELFSPPEYVYPIFKEIGPEDMEKIYKGEPYKIYLREVSIDASKSRFVLRLNYHIVFIAYVISVFTWSLIYFQIKKIIYHIRGKSDN